MKTIGIVIAVEIQAVFNKYGCMRCCKEKSGFKIYEYLKSNCKLIIINCGAGEIAAAAGTQILISEYKTDIIINLGAAGGLTSDMSLTKLCVVDKVVHYDFDTSKVDNVEIGRYSQYPGIYIPSDRNLLNMAVSNDMELKPVICASGDKFIADPDKKRYLHETFNADICEMEAAGILLTCNRNNIPCLMIKIVSDSINGGAEEFHRSVDEAAEICMNTVDNIIDTL